MTSKLIHVVVMDCETFNQLPALEKVRVLFRTPSNIYDETCSITVSKVKLKPLTNLSKWFILDARVDRECVCAGGYNAVLVIQKEIFP